MPSASDTSSSIGCDLYSFYTPYTGSTDYISLVHAAMPGNFQGITLLLQLRHIPVRINTISVTSLVKEFH